MARYLLLLHDEVMARRRQRQRKRSALEVTEIPNSEFIKNYRLSKEAYKDLCEDVIPLLPPKRNHFGVSPATKVLVALNFFARGSYQGSVGLNSDAPMAQQTVSRCIRDVTNALNQPEIVTKYIRFPQDENERNIVKSRFYNKFGIPGVCGCIDGTHIAITQPNEHEERFYNRKGFHSLNVQMVCDAHCYILNVDAGHGGASHDSFIWNESELKSHFESLTAEGERNFLLGDSGYPLREYLITPFGEIPDDSPEAHFNKIHKKTRVIVEQTFGILKGRFRCLLSDRVLHYAPETAGKITIACCVLHNLCIKNNLEAIALTENEREDDANMQPATYNTISMPNQEALQRGRMMRAILVEHLARNRT